MQRNHFFRLFLISFVLFVALGLQSFSHITGGGPIIVVEDTPYCVEFPVNPSYDGSIHCKTLEETDLILVITIANAQNEILASENPNSKTYNFDVSDLQPGSYILYVRTDNCEIVRTVEIEE